MPFLSAKRNNLKAWWAKKRGKSQQQASLDGSSALLDTALRQVSSRPQLAHRRSNPVAENRAIVSERVSQSQTRPVQIGANGRPVRGRAFRYGQRQDSGGSIHSIPSYNAEAGDDELVLVKPEGQNEEEIPRPSFAIRPSMDEVRPSMDSIVPSSHELSRSSTSSDAESLSPEHSPSVISHTTSRLEPPEYVYRSRSHSSPATPMGSNIHIASIASASQVSLASTAGDPMSRSTSAMPNFHPGHRAAQSMDGPSPASSSRGFRTVFRNRGPSASKNQGIYRGKVAGQASSSASSLVISSPLPDTFVSSSSIYKYPRSGLSSAQMSFLSSRESLLRMAGVPANNEAPSYDVSSAPPSIPLFSSYGPDTEEAAEVLTAPNTPASAAFSTAPPDRPSTPPRLAQRSLSSHTTRPEDTAPLPPQPSSPTPAINLQQIDDYSRSRVTSMASTMTYQSAMSSATDNSDHRTFVTVRD